MRNDLSRVLGEAQTGTRFTITLRGRPAARLLPLEEPSSQFVDRATLRRILATPIDSAELAADLGRAEARLDDPRNGD